MDSLALWLGLVGCAAAAGAGLLAGSDRRRLISLTVAVVLAPVLIAADNWQSPQLASLRDRPVLLALAAVVGVVALLAAALLLRRRPRLLAIAAIAASPFRIPLDLGGQTANLLLPLYAVLAVALVAAWIERIEGQGGAGLGPVAQPDRSGGGARHGLRRLLAADPIAAALGLAIVVYALQAGYAADLSTAVEDTGFFFAPFAALYWCLRRVEWDRELIGRVLIVLTVEALLIAIVAFGQYAAQEVFWNDKVIAGNEAHTWFRVNSLFYDPNIMGRFLAIVMLGLAGVAAWARPTRPPALATACFVILLAAVAITFSQSSLLALLAGLLALALFRWGVGWASLAALLVAAALGLSLLTVDGGGLAAETTGRTGLISGGLELAGERPLLGYGSGSFASEFEGRFGGEPGDSFVSHTEPITVAAEQGVVGLIPYLALLGVAAWVLLGAAAAGWRGARRPPAAVLAACLAAMFIHSLGYAAFLIDPITWTILAIGAAAAAQTEPLAILDAPKAGRPQPGSRPAPA